MLVGMLLGIGSVVAGSAAAAPGAPTATSTDATCEDNLEEALNGWEQCRGERDACRAKLKKCGGIIHFPSCGQLLRPESNGGGLTHRLLLEAIRVRAHELSVSDAASLEKTMLDEFARRAATAEPKALEEMSSALDSMRAQAEKTEVLLEAAAKAP